MTNVTPVLHRVFIQPDKLDEADDLIKRAKAAGIAIEIDKREHKAVVTGRVVAIGSTAYVGFQTTADEQGVKIGSRVLYVKYSGADIPQSEWQVVNDEDILAVLGE